MVDSNMKIFLYYVLLLSFIFGVNIWIQLTGLFKHIFALNNFQKFSKQFFLVYGHPCLQRIHSNIVDKHSFVDIGEEYLFDVYMFHKMLNMFLHFDSFHDSRYLLNICMFKMLKFECFCSNLH